MLKAIGINPVYFNTNVYGNTGAELWRKFRFVVNHLVETAITNPLNALYSFGYSQLHITDS